jgi:malonyl-CoA/methylmalonyl-CoA synthetase
MTELGMVLSNPLDCKRHKGHVGKPLPYVECRLVDDNEEEITSIEIPGELRVKGPCVFKEYYNRPDETIKSFDKFGWFKTGDIAIINSNNDYRLLGRNSTDIIKSAGYKLSALEIERELLSHPEIKEVAVLGIKDDQLGEKVVAIITVRKDINVNEDDPTSNSTRFLSLSGFGCDVDSDAEVTKSIHLYLKDKLAKYKQPVKVIVVSNLPRNLLGKINKKTLLFDLSLVNI